jgi:hypothetical protein
MTPPRANRTTRMRMGPKIILQCSVIPARYSSRRRKAAAPTIAP